MQKLKWIITCPCLEIRKGEIWRYSLCLEHCKASLLLESEFRARAKDSKLAIPLATLGCPQYHCHPS